MAGFKKKKLKSKTLGEKLRQSREKAGIDLAEIAKNTRIKLDYLEKIERDNFDELPPDVYVKGFLKSYAKYLGLNEQEVVNQYKRERGIQKNLRKLGNNEPKKILLNFPNITITPRAFSVIFFSLALFAGFFYFYKEIDKFSENPRLVIIQPFSNTSVKGSSIEIIGITDKHNKVTINDQPIVVNENGDFKETIGLQKGLNKITVKAQNKFEKITQEELNISADYEVMVAGEETEKNIADVKNEKVVVEISVRESPVWIAVKVDDKDVQSGTMLPNSTQIFEGKDKILVTSGKANQTFIKFNGEDIGLLDENPGLIREVIFSRDSRLPVKNETSKEKGSETEEEKEEERMN
ncbi:MAG: DUF4115 domain-containing protein [Candidatus Moranbacteria bacterium]|jgi:cytoskeletal protein RodZ|nr:DUF4115 domain-containing protein [Candidatus Moranbacteria bacterium]